MKIRLLQLNPIVGDIENNALKLFEYCQQASLDQVDVVITPECYLCGYPPEDLIFRKVFQDVITEKTRWLAEQLAKLELGVILGTPRFEQGKIYNSALWIYKGEIKLLADKQHLPDYGVFDDDRLFSEGTQVNIIKHKNTVLGVMICEDMWHSKPALDLHHKGAELLISLNASPFEANKLERRYEVAKSRVRETSLPLIACFIVGGQDEIVFDGLSFAIDKIGNVTTQAKGFCEDALDILYKDGELTGDIHSDDLSQEARIYQAVTLGLRDYIGKNGFKKIVLGLSGGVDSVLSAVIAVDAIGAENVHCLLLPSKYTSQESFDDAYAVIHMLGMTYDVINIQEIVDNTDMVLDPVFKELPNDLTEENIQSRVRGLLLMAYSNKFGSMVLTTGNKSEMAVGYATLYGDMCGGFNVLKDLYKTQIYGLCHYRNQHKPEMAFGKQGVLIPETVITKAPTAELRDNQKDSDSLPEYDVLDKILYAMIEQELSIADIVVQGFDEITVRRIRSLVDKSEYKRRQSAPGAKISSKNFGRDRRYPITHRFRF